MLNTFSRCRVLSACIVLGAALALTSYAEEMPVMSECLAIGTIRDVTLDGRLDEWPAEHARILLGEVKQSQARAGRWNGARDLAGLIHLAWDDAHLYLAADVADDKLMQAQSEGAEPWQGDTIELFFNAFPGQHRSEGFRQVALIPAIDASREVSVACPQGEFPGVEGATVTHAGGYTVECRIPWTSLPHFTPAPNVELGFQLMLDDRDGRGRKSQLFWYPSAITYVQPTHMNRLMLRERPSSPGASVLAGPPASFAVWPRRLDLSLAADVEGAALAKIVIESSQLTAPLATNVPLARVGNRLAVGETRLRHELTDGPVTLHVEVADEAGTTLVRRSRPVELAGERYQAMRERIKALRARMASPEFSAADSEALAGLNFWVTRCGAISGNEARPEAAELATVERVLAELDVIEAAMGRLAAGEDPYKGLSGPVVRAYRSPLTGEFRPHALFLPASLPQEDRLPLIVVLHGIYADTRQLFQMEPNIKDLGAIVYQAASYRQFDWHDISAAETEAGLTDVLKRYPVDRDRIYLIGHHIGGRGALQLAIQTPDRYAAIAALYPGIDTEPPYPALELYPQYFEQANRSLIPPPHFRPVDPPAALDDPVLRRIYEGLSLAEHAERITHLPIRIVTGESRPHAVAEMSALVDRLTAAGNRPVLNYHPGAMHGSTPPELSDPEFYGWLLSHRRTPPKTGPSVSHSPVRSFVQKNTSLQGPINDAFRSKFIYVYGDADDSKVGTHEAIATKLANRGLGATFLLKAAAEVSAEDIRDANLVLIGIPESNELMGKIADRIPVKWLKDGFQIGDQVVSGARSAAWCIRPNPLNASRYVVVVYGNDLGSIKFAWRNRFGCDYVLAGPNADGELDITARGSWGRDWSCDDSFVTGE